MPASAKSVLWRKLNELGRDGASEVSLKILRQGFAVRRPATKSRVFFCHFDEVLPRGTQIYMTLYKFL